MKILHTADIHIGYDTHGRLDQASGLNSRWIDFKKCFDFMVKHAIDEDIDLFLFCGDAYRDAIPTPTEQRLFSQCLRPLFEARIPIVMLVGNHDHPISFGRASSIDIFSRLVTTVTLFSKPDVKDIDTKSGKVRIVGLPWPIKNNLFAREEFAGLSPEQLRDKIYETYVQFVETKAEEIRSENLSYPSILACHLQFDTAQLTNGSEKIKGITKDPLFTVASLAKPEFSYVAVGHIHKHQELNGGNAPPVVYSGSIERISFSEYDQPKGFVMIDIDETKRATFRHIQTPARPFISIELDVRDEAEPMPAILAAFKTHAISTDEKAPFSTGETGSGADGAGNAGGGAIVRVRLQCHEAQKPKIDTDVLREALGGAFTIAELALLSEERDKKVRAAEMNKFMSATEALETYIGQNPHLLPVRDRILRAAEDLEHEAEFGKE